MPNIINFEAFKAKKVIDNLSDERLKYDKKIMNNVYEHEIKTFESMLKYVDQPEVIKMWMIGWVKDKKKFLKKDIRQINNESLTKKDE
jgi:hypothetical protein